MCPVQNVTYVSGRSPLAVEAVRRIDAIFDIERAINGRSAEECRDFRQEHSAPLAAALETLMREHRVQLSRNAKVAEAMDDMLRVLLETNSPAQ